MENILKQSDFSRENKPRRGRGFGFGKRKRCKARCQDLDGSLAAANLHEEYTIKSIKTCNLETNDFLFTLGCYPGESITLISKIANQYIVVIKDARYSIDKNLAACISI